MQKQDKEKGRPAAAGRPFWCISFEISRQGHDGGDDGQRGRLAAEDAGAEAYGLCPGLRGHLGFLGGKAALCAGDDGELQLWPSAGFASASSWRRGAPPHS